YIARLIHGDAAHKHVSRRAQRNENLVAFMPELRSRIFAARNGTYISNQLMSYAEGAWTDLAARLTQQLQLVQGDVLHFSAHDFQRVCIHSRYTRCVEIALIVGEQNDDAPESAPLAAECDDLSSEARHIGAAKQFGGETQKALNL